MAAKVICVMQQKGGVGKTTTACNIAHALARAGHPTLLIDFDPQGQDAVMLGMKSEQGVFYFLTADPNDPDSVNMVRPWIRKTGRDNLWLIAGNEKTGLAQIALSQGGEKPYSYVRSQLNPFIRNGLGYVVLDTSPSVGGLQERAIWASDVLLVPTSTEFASLQALTHSMVTAHDLAQDKGWKGGVLGILPTFYDETTRESRLAMERLNRSSFGCEILNPIHRATILRECWAARKTIFEMAPKSRSADEYQDLADIILKRY